jgi:hypothetical protein
MRLTLGIMTKYIDRHPTASMTKNPLADPNKHNMYDYIKIILIMLGSSQDLNMKHMVEKTTI